MTPAEVASADFLRVSVLENPFVPEAHRTPHPRQAQFLLDMRPEVLFGGSAGGGKSWALLAAALQFVDRPGYAALILRRTYQDLAQPGAIMDRAIEWLRPHPEVRWNSETHTFTFPSSARLTFGYLDARWDHLRYQGAELQFCCVPETPVLMADETVKQLGDVRLGDVVATLEGPRRVTYVSPHLIKTCVRLTVGGTHVVMSEDHRVLGESSWVCPGELKPSRSCDDGSTHEECSGSNLEVLRPYVFLPRSRQQGFGHASRFLRASRRQEISAWSGGAGSGSGASDGCSREFLTPGEWSVRVALAGLPRQSTGRGSSRRLGLDALVRATAECEVRDSLADRPFCLGFDGGRSHQVAEADRVRTPSRDDCASEIGSHSRVDRRTHTRRCSRRVLQTFVHPYTMGPREVSFGNGLRLARASIAPAGVRVVLDLRVEGASHYLTPTRAGEAIIHRNCSFDELTQFEETPYRYLFSRLRRLEGSDVPLRMRAASNPGGPGNDWVRARFVDARESGRGFVRAGLSDNPSLDQEAYIQSLSHLDPVARRQLLEGDWSARPEGGLFRREWFRFEDSVPEGLAQIVRWWDLAAGGNDWTVGLKMGIDRQRRYHVLDVSRLHADPAGVEAAVRAAADRDGSGVVVLIGEEPGSAGKSLVDHYRRNVVPDRRVEGVRETGPKWARAQPVAGHAAAGNVVLVRGAWNVALLDEVEAFCEDARRYPHDDQVDALAGAHAWLASKPSSRPGQIGEFFGFGAPREGFDRAGVV